MLLFFGPLGGQEILVIILLALLLFGPKKIPEIARSLGKGFREFKQSTSGLMDSINEEVKDIGESPARPAKPARQTAAQSAPASPARLEAAKPAAIDDVEETVIDLESDDQKTAAAATPSGDEVKKPQFQNDVKDS